jgi:hypothetical protein
MGHRRSRPSGKQRNVWQRRSSRGSTADPQRNCEEPGKWICLSHLPQGGGGRAGNVESPLFPGLHLPSVPSLPLLANWFSMLKLMMRGRDRSCC